MKRLPLSKGLYALVDDEDYDYLNQWKWHYHGEYAARNEKGVKKRKMILMHRVIAKTPREMITDHINGNPLDNRKANLRWCSLQQNAANSRKLIKKTSMYKGVSWDTHAGKWKSVIYTSENGKRVIHRIGRFKEERQAALAYDLNAIVVFGEYAKLNFEKDVISSFYSC